MTSLMTSLVAGQIGPGPPFPQPRTTPRPPAVPVCDQPRDGGTLSMPDFRYYFDKLTQECRAFVYLGQGGNSNNFGSIKDCVRECQCSKGLDIGRSLSFKGLCLPSMQWYYDDSSIPYFACRPFLFLGCGGNGNKFKRKSLCLETCKYDTFFKQIAETEDLIALGFPAPRLPAPFPLTSNST